MYTKNGNILEPEIIPFYLIIYIQYILCYELISIETLNFKVCFFFKFPHKTTFKKNRIMMKRRKYQDVIIKTSKSM